jgi:hypothetical protein
MDGMMVADKTYHGTIEDPEIGVSIDFIVHPGESFAEIIERAMRCFKDSVKQGRIAKA